ncbi:hypothetical protein L9F63_010503, partial [Diploptera punctata]
LGEKGSGLRAQGDVQDFYKIREDCLKKKILFQDPDFPAIDSSIFYSKMSSRKFEWKRPSVSNQTRCKHSLYKIN